MKDMQMSLEADKKYMRGCKTIAKMFCSDLKKEDIATSKKDKNINKTRKKLAYYILEGITSKIRSSSTIEEGGIVDLDEHYQLTYELTATIIRKDETSIKKLSDRMVDLSQVNS